MRNRTRCSSQMSALCVAIGHTLSSNTVPRASIWCATVQSSSSRSSLRSKTRIADEPIFHSPAAMLSTTNLTLPRHLRDPFHLMARCLQSLRKPSPPTSYLLCLGHSWSFHHRRGKGPSMKSYRKQTAEVGGSPSTESAPQ